MNYTKHYNSLIDRARNRKVDGYVEMHHIFPRCMDGTDDSDNLVALTAREHYVAHQLLVKMYPGVSSLVYAANMMTVDSNGNRVGNRGYGWLKQKWSTTLSHEMKGKLVGDRNGMWGKTHSERVRRDIAASRLGTKDSSDTRLKKSISHTGENLHHWITDGKACLYVSVNKEVPIDWHVGRPHNINTRIGEKVVCPHCEVSGGLGIMKRWHFDKCKSNNMRVA